MSGILQNVQKVPVYIQGGIVPSPAEVSLDDIQEPLVPLGIQRKDYVSKIEPDITINPYTFFDLSDSAFWIPIQSDSTFFTLTRTITGATIQAKSQTYAQLQSCICGIASRGKFFPEIITGELSVRIDFDSYNPASDIASSRHWRIITGLMLEAQEDASMNMAGGSYGCLAGLGVEQANSFNFEESGVLTAPTVILSYDALIPIVVNNSSGFMVLKTVFKAKAGANPRQRWLSHVLINMNGTNYGGDLPDANLQDLQSHSKGLYLFCGIFASVGSPAGLGRVRFTSIEMTKGIYMPSR